jgi:hypothetical protein
MRVKGWRESDRREEKDMSKEEGSVTTEYAIVTLAAAGLAGVLVAILKSPEVRGWLMSLIGSAMGQ